jgi:hypothetical protein
VITLFPSIATMPKVKRRIVMSLVWPLVWVEANINFWIGAYACWKGVDGQ